MKKVLVSVIVTAALLAAGGAFAKDTTGNPGNGNQGCELADGSTYKNPGKMFQHLRIRDDGNAAGNPKDIVNAYPDSFDSVGNLIDKKCGVAPD